MILKLKVGAPVKVNGEMFRVSQTLMDNLSRDGVSTDATLVLQGEGGKELELEFVGMWTTAMQERCLDGLVQFLTRG